MAKSLEMLLRQNRRWRQHGDLLSAFDGEKSGSHRHFGLAITDIAADQAIRRLSPLQARQGLTGGPFLIGGSSYSKSASNSRYKVSGGAKAFPWRASRIA